MLTPRDTSPRPRINTASGQFLLRAYARRQENTVEVSTEAFNWVQIREPPVDLLHLAFRLCAHTRGFKGWGWLGLQLLCPILTILLAARSDSSFLTSLRCLKTISFSKLLQISLFQFFQFLCFITHSHSHTQSQVKSALLNGGTSKMRGGEGCTVGLPHYSCALSCGSHFGGG